MAASDRANHRRLLTIGVVDGDTIDILTTSKQTIRIRLHGIDCPERGQPFGNNAKTFLSELVFGKDVVIVVRSDTPDKYERVIGDVMFGGGNVNHSLVANGLGWWYQKYAPADHALQQLEQLARESQIGLWSDPRHVAPWDWRKLSKEERDKLR